jgi:hypothetical protein
VLRTLTAVLGDLLEDVVRLFVLPSFTRKRGVSGMRSIPTSRISEGTAARPSMSLQLPDEARIALTMNAARMPITIIIWFSEPMAPRISVGAISDR